MHRSIYCCLGRYLGVALAGAVLLACGSHKAGGMSGPTINAKNEGIKRYPLQSNDIMDRNALTQESEVQHILISWKDIKHDGQPGDPRARERTAEQAEQLVKRLLKEARDGADFTKLMRIYSEDPGSAKTGRSYSVDPGARLVYEFKHMGLRLKVGEIGVVRSQFGWHIMKRVE